MQRFRWSKKAGSRPPRRHDGSNWLRCAAALTRGSSASENECYGSLRLHARELHHLGPFLSFGGDVLAKLSGRAGKYCAAQVGEPRFHLGVGERGIDFAVELVHDLDGCVLGRTEATP